MIESYKHKLFYNPKTVIGRLDEFKKDVVENSYFIGLEQKYVNGGWREPTDKTLDWILENCNRVEDIRIIHEFVNYPSDTEKLQAVFMYIPDAWYLAWCDIDISKEKYFVNKYNLKPLK